MSANTRPDSEGKIRRVASYSGGGWHGAAEYPTLVHTLTVEKKRYDLMLGTSVGAVHAAIGATVDPHRPGTWELLRLLGVHWNAMDDRNLIDGIKGYLAPALHRGDGLFHLGPLRERLVTEGLCEARLQTEVGLGIVPEEGEYQVLRWNSKGPIGHCLPLIDGVIASAAIGGLMEPVRARIQPDGPVLTLTDGGHENVLPLPDEGTVDELDAVFARPIDMPPTPLGSRGGIARHLGRGIERLLERIRQMNYATIVSLAKSGVKTRVFAPKVSIGGLLDADRETIQARLREGTAAALAPTVL